MSTRFLIKPLDKIFDHRGNKLFDQTSRQTF
uniref:Uncharacterized protein n=1 Tax=viral metagenome TaxID=1070528 RepID=A0A6C0CG08_9ZZZZ